MQLKNLKGRDRGTERRMMQSLTVPRPGANIPEDGRWIPVPDIPVQPVLSAATFRKQDGPTVPSILDAGQPFYVTAGRIEIAESRKHQIGWVVVINLRPLLMRETVTTWLLLIKEEWRREGIDPAAK
jgi:hypothetical protein